jgi:hypothetical protein
MSHHVSQAEIDAKTDLYDHFGETGVCVICQDDLNDGDRVRAIIECQHIFHVVCIDPWLKQKGECPLCRISIRDPILSIHASANIMRRLFQENPNTFSPQFQNIIQQINVFIENNIPMPEPALSVNRYVLTYCLLNIILKRFSTAGEFNVRKQHIMNFLTTFQNLGHRPFPIDCTRHSALRRTKDTMRREIQRRLNLNNRGINKNETVIHTTHSLEQNTALQGLLT